MYFVCPFAALERCFSRRTRNYTWHGRSIRQQVGEEAMLLKQSFPVSHSPMMALYKHSLSACANNARR